MRAIILAAGCAKRLEPVFRGKPKCLLELGGIPLIEHQLRALSVADIAEYIVVVGYEQQQIRDYLNQRSESIVYIENPLYGTTNTLYSLWLTHKYFDDDFIYANADVLFDHRVIDRLIRWPDGSRFACIRGKCGQEEVKVAVEGDQIVEIGKEISEDRSFGEFIGIARFDRNANSLFKEILSDCIEDKDNWNRFFEYAANILAQETPLHVADISDLPATEIDFPEDLRYAQEQILPLLVQHA